MGSVGRCSWFELLLAQMPASQIHEHILKTRLARREMFQLRGKSINLFEQRRNSPVRLADAEAHSSIFIAHGLNSRERAPRRTVAMRIARKCEFNHVMSPEFLNQLGRCSLGNNLPVINNRNSITQTLGLVHVVRG